MSWAKRHPAWSATIALVALAAVLFVVQLLVHGAELAHVNSKLADSLRDAQSAEHEAREAERQTKVTLYAADMLLADKSRRSGDALQFGNLLARHLPVKVPFRNAKPSVMAQEDDDYRGFEWHYLSRFANSPVATLPPIPGRIHCVNFSSDGRWLATSGDDGKARLFDATTLKELAVSDTTHRDVRSAIISPDRQALATCGDDGTICLWDIASRNQRWQVRPYKGIAWRLAFALEGKILLSIGNVSTVRLWNVADGSEAGELTGLPGGADSLATSADGRWVAAGGGFGWIILWDVASRQRLGNLTSEDHIIHALAFARTQPVLAAGGSGGATSLWDISNPAEPRRLLRDVHLDEIRSLAFSPDDRQLAISDRSGAVRIWTFETPLADLLGKLNGEPTGVSPRTNSSIPSDNRPRPNGLRLATTNIPAHRGRTESVAFSPDGTRLASGGLDGLVKFWNPQPSQPSRILLTAPQHQFFDMALSQDSQSLVTAEATGVALRDPETGDLHRWLTQISERWDCVAVSADNQHVAAASHEGTLLWWSLKNLDAEPQRLNGLNEVDSLRFSATEPLLGVAQRVAGRVHFFRGGLNQPRRDVIYPNCSTIAISPNGRQFATDDMLGDVATLQPRHELVGHFRSIFAIEFHPHGHLVATCGSDRQIILWDTETGAARHTLTGHRAAIQTLAFSPDGRSLVSGESTGAAKVWQVASGQEVCDLDLPNDTIDRLLFAPDGKSIYALMGSRQVIVLDVSPTSAP